MVGVSPTLAIYFYLVLWQSGYMQRSFKPYKVGSTPTGTTNLFLSITGVTEACTVWGGVDAVQFCGGGPIYGGMVYGYYAGLSRRKTGFDVPVLPPIL